MDEHDHEEQAAGVHEENPMGVPRRSMVVYGAPTPMACAQQAAHGDPPQGDGGLRAGGGSVEVALLEGGAVVGGMLRFMGVGGGGRGTSPL